MNIRLLATLIFVGILALTNRWLSYEEGITVLKAADTQSYMAIAQAAPALPSPSAPEGFLPTNHSMRFVMPYVAGALAYISGIRHEYVFLICTLLFSAMIVVVHYRMFNELGMNDMQHILLMALLIFNPYTFRYYLAVPAMMNDIVFVAGLSLTLLGLVLGAERSGFALIFAGCLLALAGRQNALVYLPALGMWMMWGEQWRKQSVLWRLSRFGVVVVSMVLLYIMIGRIVAGFSVQGMESDALTGLARWMLKPAAGKMKIFAEYFLRTAMPLLFPLALLAGTILAGKTHRSAREFFSSLPRDFGFAILFVAALYGFAFLGGPDLFMTGVTRYVSHAFPAFLCALGITFRTHGLFATTDTSTAITHHNNLSPAITLIFCAVVAASFHHITTFGGSSSDKAMYFAVIYCILAIFVGLLSYFFGKYKV